MLPFVDSPMEQERLVRLKAQQRTRPHCRHATIEFPYFDGLTFRTCADVSIVSNVDLIEHFGVGERALQLDVFGVRPQQRHRRASWTTKIEMSRRQIRSIPDLLRNQADTLRELLERAQKWSTVSSGGDFVMTTLASQQRPRTSLAPTVITGAIFSLPEAVVVVATPRWTMRRVDLDDGIDNAQRILNDWIVCAANSVSHQFQKTGVDDLFRRKLNARAGRPIRQCQGAAIWIFIRAIDRAGRIHAHVMTSDAWHESAFGRDGPPFDVRFKKVGIIANECGRNVVAAIGEELRGTDERGDVDRECRRRIPARFFPAILRSNRSLADKETTRAPNHMERIEVSQRLTFPESPRQQD